MSHFLTYSKFYTAEDAVALIDMIQKEGVPFELDHERNQLDNIYIGEIPEQLFVLRIPQDQFATVNRILVSAALEYSEVTDPDYYIYSLSNEELIDVVNHQHYWNAFDRTIAQKILLERDPSADQLLKAKPYEGERLATRWIALGYVLCFFAFAGIFIGLSIHQGKKTLNNGEVVFIYDKKSKRHGDLISVFGMISTIWFALNMFREMLKQSSFTFFDN